MMTDAELLEQFSVVLSDLLGDESIALTMTTRREEVDGWDSFNYINFIASVEMQLGIKFNISDIESFENVGAIVRRTQALQSR